MLAFPRRSGLAAAQTHRWFSRSVPRIGSASHHTAPPRAGIHGGGNWYMHDTEIYEPRYCEGISQQKKRKPNSVDGKEYANVTVFRVRTRSFTFQFLLLLCAQTRCEQSTKTCAVCLNITLNVWKNNHDCSIFVQCNFVKVETVRVSYSVKRKNHNQRSLRDAESTGTKGNGNTIHIAPQKNIPFSMRVFVF